MSPLPLEGILFSVEATFSCSDTSRVYNYLHLYHLLSILILNNHNEVTPMEHFSGCYGTNCDINRTSCKSNTGQGEGTKGHCELLGEGKNYD